MMGILLLLQDDWDHHRIRTAGLIPSGRIPVNEATDCQTSRSAHRQHIVLFEKGGGSPVPVTNCSR